MSILPATALPQNSTNVRSSGPPAARLIGGLLRMVDAVAPRLAARLAGQLFLTPRRLPRPEAELSWCANASRGVRMVAGLPIAIWSRGEGRPVLLAHGWEGRGSQLAALADALVADGFHVVIPDFPAHGDSPGRTTNLFQFVAIVQELAAELHPHAIVAHSFGCGATNVALRNSPFAGRLVYLAPPEDFDFFTALFSSMLGLSKDLGVRMQQELERRFDIRWSQLRGTALAPAMAAPLLVIHDEDDIDVPLRFGQALAAAWPGARLMITQGLGHRRILRDPAVIEAARCFVSAR